MTNYHDAGEKTQMVIDYCALNAVVPRKSSDPVLPDPWQGVTTGDVKEGVKREFGVTIGNGTATYTWQRLGADNDRATALEFLEERRQLLQAADLAYVAGWNPYGGSGSDRSPTASTVDGTQLRCWYPVTFGLTC